MILILLIRNNSSNNSLDFTRRKGLQGNHIYLIINSFAKEKDKPVCVAGNGFFPFFCFISLIKLRQQNVTCASRNILTCKGASVRQGVGRGASVRQGVFIREGHLIQT